MNALLGHSIPPSLSRAWQVGRCSKRELLLLFWFGLLDLVNFQNDIRDKKPLFPRLLKKTIFLFYREHNFKEILTTQYALACQERTQNKYDGWDMQLLQLCASVEVFDQPVARRGDLVDLDPQAENVTGAEDEDDAKKNPGRLLPTTLEPSL